MKKGLYIYILLLLWGFNVATMVTASASASASATAISVDNYVVADVSLTTNQNAAVLGAGEDSLTTDQKTTVPGADVDSLTTNQNATVPGAKVNALTIERNAGWMAVDMNVDLSLLDVPANRAVLFTPRFVNGSDSLDLPSIGVYGRQRYYYYLRNNGAEMISGKDEKSFRASRCPDTLSYHCLVPFSQWMDGSQLILDRLDYGCCRHLIDRQSEILGSHAEAFFPELVYSVPAAERIKSRSIEGSAYIDFPVDETVIYPDYRRNREELAKISSSIDRIRDDSDATLISVSLKGFASPEGKYAHNDALAYNRTLALKRHIMKLFNFDESMIGVSHEPEDWDGLKLFVEQTNLDNKEEIIRLMDSGFEPDELESRIKSSWPEDYKFLLEHCYPALRRTDYLIVYSVCNYNDADQIERMMNTQPQKLSLNEFYLVAQEYEPGTEEFTEVFETAVRMFPDDETANLNAANAAMRSGDFKSAERYLEKAGDSPQAEYARGAFAIGKADYASARIFMQKALTLGVTEAGKVLKYLDERKL